MQDIDKFEQRLYNCFENPESEDLKIIKKYMRGRKHEGISERTMCTNYQVFLFFSQWCTKPIKELDEDDIYDFLDYLDDHTYIRAGKTCHFAAETKLTYKRTLGKFFKAVRPELGNLFKGKAEKIETKDRKDLLTKEEIENLINTARIPRDKAIIASLYESGARRGELLSCNVEHVVFDSMGCLMTFPEGKTGKRTVRLVYASSYLRNWIDNHPIRLGNGSPNQNAPLWTTSYAIEGQYNRLTDMALHFQLKKLAKKAGITKRIYPHLFRHTRATDLAEHLTDAQLKKHFGWSQSSAMTARYIHDPDTENAILRMNGIDIEETHIEGMRVGQCPRCKELNPEKAIFCLKCGMPLQGDREGDLSKFF